MSGFSTLTNTDQWPTETSYSNFEGEGLVLANQPESDNENHKAPDWSASFSKEFDPLSSLSSPQTQTNFGNFGAPSSGGISQVGSSSAWQPLSSQPVAQCADPWGARVPQRISVSGPWVATATCTIGASTSDTPVNTSITGHGQSVALPPPRTGILLPPPEAGRRVSELEKRSSLDIGSPMSAAQQSDPNVPTNFPWPVTSPPAKPLAPTPVASSRNGTSAMSAWPLFEDHSNKTVAGQGDDRNVENVLDSSLMPSSGSQPYTYSGVASQSTAGISGANSHTVSDNSSLSITDDKLLPGLLPPSSSVPDLNTAMPALLIQASTPLDVSTSAELTGNQVQQLSSEEEEKWILTDEQKAYYEGQFAKLDNGEQLVTGSAARNFFLKSRLPAAELSQIWRLSDVDHDGALNLAEFYAAMQLVFGRRRGLPLPDTLPSVLHPSCSTQRLKADTTATHSDSDSDKEHVDRAFLPARPVSDSSSSTGALSPDPSIQWQGMTLNQATDVPASSQFWPSSAKSPSPPVTEEEALSGDAQKAAPAIPKRLGHAKTSLASTFESDLPAVPTRRGHSRGASLDDPRKIMEMLGENPNSMPTLQQKSATLGSPRVSSTMRSAPSPISVGSDSDNDTASSQAKRGHVKSQSAGSISNFSDFMPPLPAHQSDDSRDKADGEEGPPVAPRSPIARVRAMTQKFEKPKRSVEPEGPPPALKKKSATIQHGKQLTHQPGSLSLTDELNQVLSQQTMSHKPADDVPPSVPARKSGKADKQIVDSLGLIASSPTRETPAPIVPTRTIPRRAVRRPDVPTDDKPVTPSKPAVPARKDPHSTGGADGPLSPRRAPVRPPPHQAVVRTTTANTNAMATSPVVDKPPEPIGTGTTEPTAEPLYAALPLPSRLRAAQAAEQLSEEQRAGLKKKIAKARDRIVSLSALNQELQTSVYKAKEERCRLQYELERLQGKS